MRRRLSRPPLEDLPSVRCLTGLPLWSSDRSTITNWRRLGVTGLNVFSAISKPRSHVDAVPFGKRHNCLLDIGLDAAHALEHFLLALAHERVHGFDLDVEEPLDRRLDLR